MGGLAGPQTVARAEAYAAPMAGLLAEDQLLIVTDNKTVADAINSLEEAADKFGGPDVDIWKQMLD
eukprot:14933704-Alexandrium_andersonii.AAC.1